MQANSERRPPAGPDRLDDSAREYLERSSMVRMADHFHGLATGQNQIPRQPVRTLIRDRITDPDVLAYHDLMVPRTGPLFSHFLASIPCILEEMSRVGVALSRLSERRARRDDRPYTFYELDAFDGSNGRTLAAFSKGRIRTFTNSPNKGNAPWFERHADRSVSKYHTGSFLEVTRDLLDRRADLAEFRDGFDYVYETAAFQFYGQDRDNQIGHVYELLKEDGLAFFLEKLSHPDPREFEWRERVKDERHKVHYFTAEEIAWKKQQMLSYMKEGQVSFDELVTSLGRHFDHVYLLWNGTNFYEFVASNDRRLIEEFVELVGQPFIPHEFCFEHPVVRRVSGPRERAPSRARRAEARAE